MKQHLMNQRSRFRLLSAAIGIAASSSAMAAPATVTYSAQSSGSALAGPNGLPLADGSLVKFGYFDAGVDFNSMLQDLTLLNTHFVELGHTYVNFYGGLTQLDGAGALISQTYGASPGAVGQGGFAASVSLDAAALGLISTQLYMWAFDAPTDSAATVFGIFSNDAWKLPAIGGATFELGSANPSDPNDYYFAARGPETSATLGGLVNRLIVTPVPEPSVGLVIALAVGGISLSRRRTFRVPVV